MQILSVAIVVAMVLGFLWGRLQYDIVAGLALMAAVAAGVVAPKEAFSGFSDDVVVIVASALVISAAIARSGVLDGALRMLTGRFGTLQAQLAVLLIFVAIASAIIKNIAALAMTIPIAIQLARKQGVSPSLVLMPMSFAALLGGLMTLVGTSPNIIVSRVRMEILGKPFGMLDFLPVGGVLCAAGLVFLVFAYRILPKDRQGAAGIESAVEVSDYLTEVVVPEASPMAGKTVADVLALAGGEARVTALIRGGSRTLVPLPDVGLQAGDIVLMQGDKQALESAISRGKLDHETESRRIATAPGTDEVRSVECIVQPNSALIGTSASSFGLHERHNLNLVAISRAGKTFRDRLRDVELHVGDVVVLQGATSQLAASFKDLGVLPLAGGKVTLGERRRGVMALAVLFACFLLVSTGLVPTAVGFAGAALAIVLFRALPLRDAYAAIDWSVLVVLAAVIPISSALQNTGATDVFARWLSTVSTGLPVWGALALIMATGMAVTPFLNNAATVLILGPISAAFAKNLGLNPEPFLMAVAIGAASDFLTPIGHQCNLLVMGPGGYRFSDYARLGAPLSLLVLTAGVPLVLLIWPA